MSSNSAGKEKPGAKRTMGQPAIKGGQQKSQSDGRKSQSELVEKAGRSSSQSTEKTGRADQKKSQSMENTDRSSVQSSSMESASQIPEVTDSELKMAERPSMEPPPASETDLLEGEETGLATFMFYEGRIGRKEIPPVSMEEPTEIEESPKSSSSEKSSSKSKKKSGASKQEPAKKSDQKKQPDDGSISPQPNRVSFASDKVEKLRTPDDSGDYDILMPLYEPDRTLIKSPKVRVGTTVNVGVARGMRRIGKLVYRSKQIEKPKESQPVQKPEPAEPKEDTSCHARSQRIRTFSVESRTPTTKESTKQTPIVTSSASMVQSTHQDSSPGWQEQRGDTITVQVQELKAIDRPDKFAIERAAVNVQEMKQSSDGQCTTAVSMVVPTKGPQMREGCGVEKPIQKSSVRFVTFAPKSETIPPRAIKSERTGTQQAKTKEPVSRQQHSKGDVSKKVVPLASVAPSHRQSPDRKSVDRLAPKAQQMKPSGRTIKLFETESSVASVMTPSAKGETASSETIKSEKVTGRRPREEDRPQKVSIGKAALATVEPSHRRSSEKRSVDRVPAPVNRMKQAVSETIKPTSVGKGSADTTPITKVHIFDPHLARDPDRLKPTRANPLRAASADSTFRDSTVQQVVDRAVVRVGNVSTSAAPTAQRVSTSKATTQIPHFGKTTPKKPVQGVAHRAHLVKGEMKGPVDVSSDGPDSKMVGNELATAVPIKESTFKRASPIAVEKLLLVPAVVTPISTTPVDAPKRAQPKVGDGPKEPVKESGRQKEAPEETAKESGRPKEPAKPKEVERPARKLVPIRVERTKPVQPDRSALLVEEWKTPGSKGPAYQEPRTVEKAATKKRTPVKTMPVAREQALSPKARPSPTEMAKTKEAAVEPETEGPKMVVDIDAVFDVSVFEVSEDVNDAANENGVAGGNKAEDQPMINGADEAGVGGPLPIDFAGKRSGKSRSSSQQKPISWMSSRSDGRATPTPDKTENGKSPGSSTSRSGTPTSRRSELSGRPSSIGKPGTEDEGSPAEEDTKAPRFRSQSSSRRPKSAAKYKSIPRSQSDVAPRGNKFRPFPSVEAEPEISGWQHLFSGPGVNEFIRKMMTASPGIPIQMVKMGPRSKPKSVFIDSSGRITKQKNPRK